MRFLIIIILLFSINIFADQRVLINGYNLEVEEEIDGKITGILYYLSDNDRKKLCGSKSCGDKFYKVVDPKTSEILRSTCNSRDLYEYDNYWLAYKTSSKVGIRYRCMDSLKSLIEKEIPKHYSNKSHSGTKIKINNLTIYKLRHFVGGCDYNYLDFSGPVNQDTTEVIRRLLKKTKRCTDKYSGEETPIFIFMSSGGGLLEDGFSIGKLFKDNNVNTIVPGGETCASSCTTAFLGGNKRFMGYNSTLLFHAPYKTQRNQYGRVGINCQTNNKDLENHYMQMIGNEDGDFLYKRTMDFCSASDGWKINEEAARLFGIID